MKVATSGVGVRVRNIQKLGGEALQSWGSEL